MVLYRKYRPQKLSELDSEELKIRLARILSSPYTPHAFLFSGPKGTGKTSAARIVAKVLNCEKRVKNLKHKTISIEQITDIEPCNACETCKTITEGRHLDIIEIDAASHRGIDEIRELREKIKFAPVSARFKVYIIDEVHMLTNEAFNALLKTLEEPPAHAVFILATTEPEKLPATIVSRCITFNFHKASAAEMVHCLKRVARGEKISVPNEVLTLIANTSDGSFRDATKVLEQAILENALTEEKLILLLGRGDKTAEFFLRIMAEGKTKEVLEEIGKLAGSGVDFSFFVTELLGLLHSILLAQHDFHKENVPADLAKLFPKDDVLALIKLFSRVYLELKTATIPQLPLEVAMVEWCEKGGVYV